MDGFTRYVKKALLILLSISISACGFGLKHEAENAVREVAKDPDSVLFKDLVVGKINNKDAVCGFFNAKNGFGAYTGYKKFVYSKQLKEVFIIPEEKPDDRKEELAISSIVKQACMGYSSDDVVRELAESSNADKRKEALSEKLQKLYKERRDLQSGTEAYIRKSAEIDETMKMHEKERLLSIEMMKKSTIY